MHAKSVFLVLLDTITSKNVNRQLSTLPNAQLGTPSTSALGNGLVVVASCAVSALSIANNN